MSRSQGRSVLPHRKPVKTNPDTASLADTHGKTEVLYASLIRSACAVLPSCS